MEHMLLRPSNAIIGFTCSAFDLLHAGHVAMLEEAKSVCDYLIVGLQSDPSIDRPEKNKPIQSLIERQMQLRGSRYVDEIWIYNTEEDLQQLLLILPINVRVLGVEYEHNQFTGKEICLDRNIKLYFNKRDHNFSSSSLRNKIELNE